ncbi:hypothetical protein NKJ26_29645 [Mesorhizobium sp. M0152]
MAVVGREAAHRDAPVIIAGGIHAVGSQLRSRELALGGGDGYDTDS